MDFDQLHHRASSLSLYVCRTQLSTVGDRAFPVCCFLYLEQSAPEVTSAPSMSVFGGRLEAILLGVPSHDFYRNLYNAWPLRITLKSYNLFIREFQDFRRTVCLGQYTNITLWMGHLLTAYDKKR